VHDALAASVAEARLIEPDPAVAVIVPPPQVPVTPLGVETSKPAGRLSVNAIPLNGMAALGLLIVKLSIVELFSGTVAAPKLFVIAGGAATLRFAEAVLPVPPFAELTLPVTLVYCPAVAPVTVTLKTHVPPAAIVAPASEIPAGAVVVTVPPQAALVPFTTVSPVGSVSVNATPVSGAVLTVGFVSVKPSAVVPANGIPAGLKAFAITGGATTVKLAEAVAPVPPSVDVTFPVVLFCAPATVPVTLTANVQEALCARLAPDKLTTFVACVAVMLPPPHVPESPFGVEITSPDGRVSLKAIPSNVVVVLLF
jgi:hypothetical protein